MSGDFAREMELRLAPSEFLHRWKHDLQTEYGQSALVDGLDATLPDKSLVQLGRKVDAKVIELSRDQAVQSVVQLLANFLSHSEQLTALRGAYKQATGREWRWPT